MQMIRLLPGFPQGPPRLRTGELNPAKSARPGMEMVLTLHTLWVAQAEPRECTERPGVASVRYRVDQRSQKMPERARGCDTLSGSMGTKHTCRVHTFMQALGLLQ